MVQLHGHLTPSSSSVASFETVTILGIGSLLSEKSSRLSFPNLQSFRLGRVHNYRRVFGHCAAIFVERGIGNLETLELSSISAEPCQGTEFVCSVFEIPRYSVAQQQQALHADGISTADAGNVDIGLFDWHTGEITREFREREEEFDIRTDVYYEEWTPEPENCVATENGSVNGRMGILCCRSTDTEYVERWGYERYHKKYIAQGLHTIWGWEETSGLKPCPLYLRHCLMAARRMGEECYNSFLDETFLVDRVTSLRQYMSEADRYEQLANMIVPPHLAERYGG